jgi:diguanylate cyclase (GGDEF)-like protein
MLRRLAELEKSAQEHLRMLQDPSADRGVILRLLETSCLLELSKLTAAQVDLATFVSATVTVIVQFFPVKGCAVALEPEGLPRAETVFGELPVGPEDFERIAAEGDGDVLALRLNALAQPVGHLVIAGLPSFIDDPSFFATAADQLSAVLGAMVAAERMRRQVAVASAMQIAATLEHDGSDDQLHALCDALAALPGATGAQVRVEHPAIGAPTTVKAGITGDGWIEHAVDGQAGRVSAHVYTVDPGASTEPLQQILERLAGTVDRVHQERQLQEQVETDPLTGAGNRRRASRNLAAALARAERTGGSVAALALDLDHFKRVNDTFGHQTGDDVLQRFTNMLFDQVRPYDTVARMGGEEFTVLLPGLDILEARAVAERILAATPDACNDALDGRLRQTVSIGIALYPVHADFGDALLRKADAALYEAKRGGRNRIVVAADAAPAAPGERRFV